MKKCLFLLIMIFLVGNGFLAAQETFPRNGLRDQRAGAFAFTGATIVVDPGTVLEGGTLLIRDGKIESVRAGGEVPAGYTQVDLSGKFVYPGLIDMYTNYGQPEPKRSGFSWNDPEQLTPKIKGPYNANDAIKSHYNAFQEFEANEKEAGEWRGLGFGSVLTFRPDGVARGSAAFVSLGAGTSNELVIRDKAAANYSFSKGSSAMTYPISAMGYVSLLRQTYLDAQWYGQFEDKPFTDKALDAWMELQALPQLFEAGSYQSLLRADRIGDEFGVQYIIKGGGDAYQRLELVKATGAPLIVPVNFPDAYDVEDPLEAYQISLSDMKHWELAPANLAHLEEGGLQFAITTEGLKNKKQFWSNLRKAIEHGLSEAAALRALTTTPAQLLRMENKVGSLKNGMLANFLITSGNLFDQETVIYENWIQGKPYPVEEMDAPDYAGVYDLMIGEQRHTLEISGKPGQQKARLIIDDTTDVKVSLKLDGEMLTLGFAPEKDKADALLTLSGWQAGRNLEGRGQQPDGNWVEWMAQYSGDVAEKGGQDDPSRQATGEEKTAPTLGDVIYPFAAYGSAQPIEAEDLLIRNATIWTMEAPGVLENADVLIRDGKIAAVGKNLNAAGARVIDGTGKHVTPGIIDEHSHIVGGGNEILTNSAMVRISDQLNADDLNMYRALSGGVTAVQVLHGSANPIGGQSALIKLRWGKGPQELVIEDADGYIKFALGENVKRSRNDQSIRYPQTRMGVEQVYVDAFTAAREYDKKWKAYQALSPAEKAAAEMPRRDLALQTLAEILDEKRFITCHSYVQSEINMLMKVAEQFDFKVNTFTHILEGYKVADKMAEHGAAGSTFSDWWAYKWEVRYAIPYNAALMHREGVVTAINSDDREMMRRLNQEAAKSIKYGGVSEEEALAMVTINPAKMLHLDDRMGSLKEGKDADVVIWSEHPLSIYARAEQTIVDGAVYFDVDRDQALKQEMERERARLVQKMRQEKANGGSTQAGPRRVYEAPHCDDVIIFKE